ncbi:MAG: hypothetical protein JXR10_02200 [Cyclobacteriaceae bacterium]
MDNIISKFSFAFIFIIVSTYSHAQTNEAKLANEYYQNGEYEKAFELYRDLEKVKSAIPLIHANYMDLLMNQDVDRLDKYLNRIVKQSPTNLNYQVDLVAFYKTQDSPDYRKRLNYLEKEYQANHYQLATIGQKLAAKKLTGEAIDFYKFSRKISNNPYSYALEVASLYRTIDDKPKMIEEYIKYAESNPANINYVKNLFQNILTEPTDQDLLEESLIIKAQKNPDQNIYSDLLLWLLIQRKDYYGAFIQAKARDNRLQKPGDECMTIARIASQNHNWEDAIDIYQYVIDKYPKMRNYAYAKAKLIESKEQMAKNRFPVDTAVIRNLSEEYLSFYREIGSNPTTLNALRSKALLHAYYLEEVDTSIVLLQSIIDNNRSPRTLVSNAKLDLGDIFLFSGQPWESTLLYSQVEKSNKETPLGYEAKLKNAKLNYYQGNFSLAKSHLDILKLATTRTTSNDALSFSQIITNNTIFDSTDQVMQAYAHIDLLIFTNQKQEAKSQIDSLLASVPNHTLADELYWLRAKIDLENGQYEESIKSLDHIITKFGFDILADDALYQKGVILQDYLLSNNQASEVYLEFLKKHPGSRHSAEIRKRFRQIREET